MTATNMCSNFGGLCSGPPLLVISNSFNWKKYEEWRIGGGRSCDPKDTPLSQMDPPSPGHSGNFKKLVNNLYKPTTALPVSYKSSSITNRPWISEDFLINLHCLTLPILLLSVKYSGLQEMTRYPHQWTARRGRMLAMIGRSVIMWIPHSHSSPLLRFHQLHVRRYRGYSSFWQQRCHYGEKAEVPATLAKE